MDQAAPAVFRKDRFFSNARGIELHEARYEARREAPGRAALLLFVHGMGEDSLTHEPLGQWLSASGVSCRILDLQGFGRSGGERGHIETFEHYLDDLSAWARAARDESPGRALYLGGHSFGSAISGLSAQRLAQESPGLLAGYFGSSPPLRLKKIVHRAIGLANPGQLREKAADGTLPAPPSEKAKRLFVTPPSRPGIAPTVTRRFAKNFDLAMEAFGRLKKLPARALVLFGQNDPVIDLAGIEDLRGRLVGTELEMHVFPARKHNLLLGSRAVEVYRKLLDWMAGRGV